MVVVCYLWYPTVICEGCNKTKSTIRLFDKEGWVEVLYGDPDILRLSKDLTLFQLIKFLHLQLN